MKNHDSSRRQFVGTLAAGASGLLAAMPGSSIAKTPEINNSLHPDGTPDLGIRNILVIHIQGAALSKPAETRSLKSPQKPQELALSVLSQYKGRDVNWFQDDYLISVFDSSAHAVQCAVQIQKEFLQNKNTGNHHDWDVAFKMGLSAGQPVTEVGDFFSQATTLARRLCSVANDCELLISTRVQDFCNVKELTRDVPSESLAWNGRILHVLPLSSTFQDCFFL